MAWTKKKLDVSEQGWVNLQKGRAFINKNFPYFYPTLMGLVPREVPKLGTMGVSPRLVLGIDFEWLAQIPEDEVGGLLMHECSHVLRDLRRIHAMPNFDLANYAFDIPINDDLRAAGVKLPSYGVFSDTHDLPPGLTGERYYELLEKRFAVNPGGLFCIDGIPVHRGVSGGMCGGCAGTPLNDEDAHDATIGRSIADIEYFRRTGINAIREAVKSGRLGRGNKTGFFQELLEFDGREKPIVPWKETAGNALRRAHGKMKCGQADYSILRPSKRSYTGRILRPGMVSNEVVVAYIEDSSASMGHPQLKAGRVEMAEAMARLGVQDAWFLCADTEVKEKPRRIRAGELKTLPVVGRGGTSFVDAIEAVVKLRPKPHIVIYATDGDGHAPKYAPRGIEFIWLLVPGSWTVRPCNWGTQILMSDLREDRKKYGFD